MDGFGAKQAEGSANFRVSCSVTDSRTPHCTHNSLRRSTPSDAAAAGLKVFEASIQAHTFPSEVTCARNERAIDIRPEHASPTSSVTAPMGSPPWTRSSNGSMPVVMTGRTIRAGGVNADGNLFARAASTCIRIEALEGINVFALSSPNE
jgi:hypothetical protein